jgi:hypothetical protein
MGTHHTCDHFEGREQMKVTYVRPAIEQRDAVQALLTQGSWQLTK